MRKGEVRLSQFEEQQREELRAYLSKLFRNINPEIARRELGYSRMNFDNFISLKPYVLPSYIALVHMVEYAGGTKKKLNEIIKKHSSLYFNYWNDLNPDDAELSQIYCVLRDKRVACKCKVIDIAAKIGTLASNVSSYETGKKAVTYRLFHEYCVALELDEFETLECLRSVTQQNLYRDNFRKKMIEAREEKGYTVYEAASLIGMNPQALEGFEKGTHLIALKHLNNACVVYGLDFNEMVDLGHQARIFKLLRNDEKTYFTTFRDTKDVEQYMMDLLEFTTISSKFDKIYKYPTPIFLSVFFLAIFNELDGKCPHHAELMTALKAIQKSSTVPETFADVFLSEEDKKIMEEGGFIALYEKFRTRRRLAPEDLASYTGISNISLRKMVKGEFIPNLENIVSICEGVGIPVIIGIEHVLRNHQKRYEELKKNVYIEKYMEPLLCRGNVTKIYKRDIAPSTVEEIINIILNKREHCYQRLVQLRTIKL